MACGAGLPLLALAVTVAYFVVAFVFPLLMRFLPGASIPLGQTTDSTHD
jgi:putative Mg2+ transporter-C (MgtC) family protein